MPRLLVLSHSFVDRLYQASVDQSEIPDDFNLPQHHVKYLYKRGGTLKDVMRLMPLVARYQPDVVFLQIGAMT